MGEDERAELLESLADEYAARLRRGERLAVTEFVAGHPELAGDLAPLCRSVRAMEELKSGRAGSTDAAPLVALSLERLGEYRILRELGRGGMGIVYEAEQETLGRRVALKVLPPSAFAGSSQVERFRQEAETASKLQHPDIVPIYGFGEEAGAHYFAMQLVDGVSLDRVIRLLDVPAGELSGRAGEVVGGLRGSGAAFWKRAAGIVASVAAALEHAHARGVLHRDIKPANLLLEPSGKVWVTDFGIAKLLDQGARTRTGDFVGTLQYAAPEQLDGVFDVRGDVYGLGLTLYELVTRRPAFDSRSRKDLLRQIRDGVPVRPRAVDPTIPRDLETVIQKATAYEPAHRYQTAAALAEDLRRFVAGLPVRAREVGPVERVWRWSRRNPVTAGLALTTAAAVLVAAIVGWSAYLSTRAALEGERLASNRARENLDEARQATARAEANLVLSLRAFDDLFDTIAGEDRALRRADEDVVDVPIVAAISDKDVLLLERTLQFYDRFAIDNADSEALREQTARAFRRAGDVQRWIGELDKAESALQRAREGYAELLRGESDERLVLELALVHRSLALVYRDQGNEGAAFSQLDRARTLLEEQREATGSEQCRLQLARLHNTIGAFVSRAFFESRDRRRRWPPLGRMRVGAHHREALLIAEDLAAEHADDPEVQLLVARTHRLLAQAMAMSRAAEESMAEIEKSLAVLGELSSRFPDQHDFRIELAEAYSTTGFFHADRDEAERRSREAVRHARELTQRDPRVTEFEDVLARALMRCGLVLERNGEHEQAASALEESVAIRESICARFPAATHRAVELVDARRRLAGAEIRLGRPQDARASLETAITELERSRRASRMFVHLSAGLSAELHRELAGVLRGLGEHERAAAEEREARAAARRGRPPPFEGR